MKKFLLYFAIFGFIFGIVNELDDNFGLTGGDTPLTYILNQPGMFVQQQIYNRINNISHSRVKELQGDLPTVPKTPLKLEQRLASESAPSRYAPGLEDRLAEKSSTRSDWLIGEKGIFTWLSFNRGKVFPFISAFAWGAIGVVFYIFKKLLMKIKLRLSVGK